MNMDAWIDCLCYLDEDDGMSRFNLSSGERLGIEVLDTSQFLAAVPDFSMHSSKRLLVLIRDTSKAVNRQCLSSPSCKTRFMANIPLEERAYPMPSCRETAESNAYSH